MDDGGKKENPVFHSEDIDKSKANSDKEYFVNVINDPFQRWLLRKKPSKVKTEENFETPVEEPQVPTEAPKKPQCRTTIRLTTERLKRGNAKYKTAIIILAVTATLAFASSIALAALLLMNTNTTQAKTDNTNQKTKVEYVNVEKPSEEQINDLCIFYQSRIDEGDIEEYQTKYSQLCSQKYSNLEPEEERE